MRSPGNRAEGVSDLGAFADMLREAVSRPETVRGVVDALIDGHSQLARKSLNLIASHNQISPVSLAMLSSSLASDFLAGEVGARPHAGGAWIDELDSLVVQLCQRLFRAQCVELRPMSGAIANGVALGGLVQPGDPILALGSRFGGHPTYREAGYAGLLGLKITDIPVDESTGTINIGALADIAERVHPKLIIVGTAVLLFPYQLGDIRAIAGGGQARIMYDGAHVLGLVGGHQFQDPLAEGADVLTGSTQKTLGGPIGGLVLTNDESLGDAISSKASGLLRNYQNNRIAALAITLAEMIQFGDSYASQVVANARTLAAALDRAGVTVVGRELGYTQSHVVLIDARDSELGAHAFDRLEQAGIRATPVALANTYPEKLGIRLGTPSITRLGARESDMRAIATLIARVLVDHEPPERVALDVADFSASFAKVGYCFEAPVGRHQDAEA
jgi:glycine hydroxymethyltransferase